MADPSQVRRYPTALLRVSFEDPKSGKGGDATAWDPSLGGMFLETHAPLESGALVALEITTPDAKVSAEARVLWVRATDEGDHRPAGMAVRFIDLPDDVSVALNRTLLAGTQERTILGIGGATKEPTQPGLAAAAVLRETQIGVAPPPNAPFAAPKPRLVISETSLPEVPAPRAAEVPAPRVAEVPAPRVVPAPRKLPAPPVSEPPPPPRKSGGGFFLFLLVLGAGAAAAYVYRGPLIQKLAPYLASTAAPAPSPAASPPSVPADASPRTEVTVPVTSTIASSTTVPISSSIPDAGRRDAGSRDAGVHARSDAGHK